MNTNFKNTLNIVQEIILVLLLLLFCKLYFVAEPQHINSDGKGYYEYLPATFIYQDLNWKFLDTLQTDGYNHKNYPGIYNEINGNKVNKYFVGTAILMSPFFGLACLYESINDLKITGYSQIFQDFIFYSALFYLWVGLLFIRKLLVAFKINRFAILLTQTILVFATPIVHYAYFQSAYSHIYSFSTISVFSFFLYKFSYTSQFRYLLISMLLLGLVFLIRPTNLTIIFIFPLFFSSLKECFKFMGEYIKLNTIRTIFALLIFVAISFLQFIIWNIQTGHLFIDSYNNETFNFLNPQILNILFSYKKGLFIYSPALFVLSVGGLTRLILQKKYYQGLVLAFLFFMVIYVLSSWWSWWYGASFGQRAFVDFYVIFAIMGGYLFNNICLLKKVLWSGLFVILIVLCFIQVDQYSRYIMSWEAMSKTSFWKIFLKTDEKYRGILWKENYDYTSKQVVKKIELNTFAELPSYRWSEFIDIKKDSLVDNFNLIHIKTNVDLNKGNQKMYINVFDADGNSIFWHEQFVFTGIEQQYFYNEIYQGESNLYLKGELPPNYYKIKIGFRTEEISMSLYYFNVNFVKI